MVGLARSAVDHLGSPFDPLLGRVMKLFEIRRDIKLSEGSLPDDLDVVMMEMLTEVGLMILLGGSKSAKLDRAFRSISYFLGVTPNVPHEDEGEDNDNLALPPAGVKAMFEVSCSGSCEERAPCPLPPSLTLIPLASLVAGIPHVHHCLCGVVAAAGGR